MCIDSFAVALLPIPYMRRQRPDPQPAHAKVPNRGSAVGPRIAVGADMRREAQPALAARARAVEVQHKLCRSLPCCGDESGDGIHLTDCLLGVVRRVDVVESRLQSPEVSKRK